MNHAHPLPVLPAQAHLRVLPSTLPSVFDYDDYHAFLRDWVARRKSVWPAYSLQLLANRAKIRSRSFLRLVCLGERRLSEKVASDMAVAMGLDSSSRARFLELVGREARKFVGGEETPAAKLAPMLRIEVREPKKVHADIRGAKLSKFVALSQEIRFACRMPGSLGPDQASELARRLREFQSEMEAWLSKGNLTSPPVPVGDPISV